MSEGDRSHQPIDVFGRQVLRVHQKARQELGIDVVGGHYPMLEKPKEFNEKLRDVLKELSKK